MLTSLAELTGDTLRARLGSVPGEKGQSSPGSEHSEAVDELESTGEALASTPFRTTEALMQLSASEDELGRAPAKGIPVSKPSCLHKALEDSFLFLVGEGGDETLHLLANLPRFCFGIKTNVDSPWCWFSKRKDSQKESWQTRRENLSFCVWFQTV